MLFSESYAHACIILQNRRRQWAVARAGGGRNGRHVGSERGYYHLHHDLDDALLAHGSLLLLVQGSGCWLRGDS